MTTLKVSISKRNPYLNLNYPVERMGDGEYEFADDGKLFKPPSLKLVSAKIKSNVGNGMVSTITASTIKWNNS